jgi:hypothetical protein
MITPAKAVSGASRRTERRRCGYETISLREQGICWGSQSTPMASSFTMAIYT